MILLALAACAPKPDRLPNYDASVFQIASAFAAKEACSCVFVSGRSEADCAEWVRVSPNVARFHVDRDAREVTARSLGMGPAKARFVDEQTGCVLVR